MDGVKIRFVLLLILLSRVIGGFSGDAENRVESEDTLIGTWRLPHYENSRLTDYLVLYEDGSGSITPVFPEGAHLGVTRFYWDVSEGHMTLSIICLFTEIITDEIVVRYELRNGELVWSFLEDDGSIVESSVFQRASNYPEPPYSTD